jgi:hypothetical protein
VIKALARGAAPGLRVLKMTGHATREEAFEGDTLQGQPLSPCTGVDRASTPANLLLRAEALAARRARGACAALGKLDGWEWSWKGDMAARKRLWVALLPGVEFLPRDLYTNHDNVWDPEFAQALRSLGAPHLRALHLAPWEDSVRGYAHMVPVLESIPSMARLEELTIGFEALSAPVLKRLGQLMAAASPRPFFPTLQHLFLNDSTFAERRVGPREFLAALKWGAARGGEFPCVKSVVLSAQHGPQEALELEAVAGAMAAGAFPCVETLHIGAEIGDQGL